MIIVILFAFLFLTGVLVKILNNLMLENFVFPNLTRSPIQGQNLQSNYHGEVTLFQHLSGTIFIPVVYMCLHSTLLFCAPKVLDGALDTVNIIFSLSILKHIAKK